ncbi:hypothetical protein [Saccharopolyspora hattusasensis]|uniref:hypothetical protein n=1 Tax=Saccharopolyspora hattusasensis TaxID=1128679 RepID=UPI003D959D50
MNETTHAFRRLCENLKYARGLVDGGRRLEAQDVHDFDVTDLYRSAWVMAVAALDHWVFEEIRHRALALLLKPDGQKPSGLRKLSVPVDLFDRIHYGGESREAVFGEMLDREFGHESYQNPRYIQEAFKHVSDVKLWAEVAKRAHAHGDQVDAKEVQARLKRIMERRNQIVHQADLDQADPNRRQPVSAEEAAAVISRLEETAAYIVMALDGGSR